MLGEWLTDIESLEAITQDDGTRALVLRMAAMSKAGTLESFLAEVRQDRQLDTWARESFVELARDESFLLEVDDYVRRTRLGH